MTTQAKTNALEIHNLLTELRKVSITGFGRLDDFMPLYNYFCDVESLASGAQAIGEHK